jgi:Kef-type K+ transport system membrane component KefB
METHGIVLLVIQLALVLVLARLLGFVVEQYLRGPRVLGELAAGMILGPYALGSLTLPGLGVPLIALHEGAVPVSPELYAFAVVGSIVILFLAGLETDLPTFLRFSGAGSLVGLGGVIVSFAVGDLMAVLFLPGITGFMDPGALFLGTLSTATSVGITAVILSERKKMSSPEGVTILAAAVLDDVIGIIILAIVVGVARVQTSGGEIAWGEIGLIALKAFGFWIGFTVVGILAAPRLTRSLKRSRSLELVATVSFGLALLIAGLSELAGLAMIIGAYVTGLALSQTDVAHEIRERTNGIYRFLAPVFFAVMGMMVNFAALGSVVGFGLLFALAAILAKLIGCGVPALVAGFNVKGALRIGAGMLPRGEVTLIVAGIGLAAGAIGEELFGVSVMTLLVASVVAPPTIIRAFQGGSGLRKEVGGTGAGRASVQIPLSFPSVAAADFIRTRILTGFRTEGFFVGKVDYDRGIYQLRRDDTLITLLQTGGEIALSTRPEDEQYVRLMLLEEILDMRDLVEGLKSLESPDKLGRDLLQGLFGQADEEE